MAVIQGLLTSHNTIRNDQTSSSLAARYDNSEESHDDSEPKKLPCPAAWSSGPGRHAEGGRTICTTAAMHAGESDVGSMEAASCNDSSRGVRRSSASDDNAETSARSSRLRTGHSSPRWHASSGNAPSSAQGVTWEARRRPVVWTRYRGTRRRSGGAQRRRPGAPPATGSSAGTSQGASHTPACPVHPWPKRVWV
jgi:hypothetical protein